MTCRCCRTCYCLSKWLLRHTPHVRPDYRWRQPDNGKARPFKVCDSGDGIEAAQLPYLFDHRFYRTDRFARDRDSGAGLGPQPLRALTGNRTMATSL
ncbi:MAG: hypothetical protein H6641_24420 [Caldilineaceae bacterium]|nr:hypothetical protein [Caldilineaceae bacterium]